jgi:hypothetical protein
MELFLASENMAFSVAVTFMVLVLLLEVLSSGIISGVLDSLIPDIDIDTDVGTDVDIEANIDTDVHVVGNNIPAISKVFIWTKDKVPMLVYFIILLSVFSIIGFITQYYVKKITGHYLPWFFSVPGALIIAVLISRYIARFFSRVIFKEETTAISSDDFVGHLATITVITAKVGKQVEARLTDKHNQIHYVFVEPEDKEAEFKVGEEVLLIRKEKDGSFKCVENELNERN